ncbi:MAG: sugar phosphate isomerase/epimerase [Lachnospiraceae bacterium]|nr:sugar phosphate isomerase/epimerase [Lachnospiraceae bacterium]
MQVGIRLHDTKKMPLEERLRNVHEQGFSCGHLALSKVIEEYPVGISALTPGFAMYLKHLFEKNQLDVAVLGCYLNLANPNEEKLREITEKYKGHIRFASLLGCGVVGTETGNPNETYTYDEEKSHTEEALQIFIKNLVPVVEYAEKMGVILAIEPVFNHIVYNPKRARRVLDTVQSPNLQIILDPVNLLHISNYQNQTEIVREAIELLGKDVAVVHIKDYIVEEDKLVSVAAGTGNMDYSDLMKFIKNEKPFIHATLENTVPENAVRAKEYIQKLWEEA